MQSNWRMKNRAYRTSILGLALALPILGLAACDGGTDATGVELVDPDSKEVIGYYDGEQQAYVFDHDTVPVWTIDTTYVGPSDQAQSGDDNTPLSNPATVDDGRDLDVPVASSTNLPGGEGVQCWQAVFGADGDTTLCYGCCGTATCRETCTELGGDALAWAMTDHDSLDTPEPRPPR